MIRRLILTGALVVLSIAGVRLFRETGYLLRGSEHVAETLAGEERSSMGVVFVFQPEDCLGSGALLENWTALLKAGEYPVHGVVVGDGRLSEAQQRVLESLPRGTSVRGISRERAAIVAEKLGYEKTPFAVVLDRQGRVAGSFPAQQQMPAHLLREMVLGS